MANDLVKSISPTSNWWAADSQENSSVGFNSYQKMYICKRNCKWFQNRRGPCYDFFLKCSESARLNIHCSVYFIWKSQQVQFYLFICPENILRTDNLRSFRLERGRQKRGVQMNWLSVRRKFSAWEWISMRFDVPVPSKLCSFSKPFLTALFLLSLPFLFTIDFRFF